jgi:hypothetical protein
VDPAGVHWLGVPGGLLLRDPAGSWREVRWEGEGVPRVLGWIGGSAYVRAGDVLQVLEAGRDSVAARREGFGSSPLLLDVRGRAVLQAAGSGAVLGHDPTTLEPVWAWAALGSPSGAVAASPQGDRVYHALADDEEGARILTRDLQTGRVLASMPIAAPVAVLATDSTGMLFALAREGRRAEVLALRPDGGELTVVWRRVLRAAEEAARVRLAVGDGRVAVWGLGPRVGLRLLEGRDGSVLGRSRTDPLDAAFGEDGSLWTLYPGELRRLE